MNLEAINKWLDEEYGCSYTRLEELHDFYFEKYCDLKKENNQLKCNWNELKEFIKKSLEAIDTIQKLTGNTIENYNPRILTYNQIKNKMLELEKGGKIMKKFQRLQGNDWHLVKNSFRLLYTYKSDNGNIKGIYTDGKTKISHWLNDEEKTDYLQSVKGSDSNE